MINKAILGGTFDPIHNAHINVAYEALERFNLQEIIFIPAGNPPHKINLKKTPAYIRYKMVKLAIEKERRFSISDFEIKAEGLSYTYKTLKHFKEKEPETNWYFITGEDCLSYLEHWKHINEIFNMCNFVIFSREGFKEKEEIIKKKKNNIREIWERNIIYGCFYIRHIFYENKKSYKRRKRSKFLYTR